MALKFCFPLRLQVVFLPSRWVELVVYNGSVHLVLASLHALWERLDHYGSTHLVHTVAHSLGSASLYSGSVALSLWWVSKRVCWRRVTAVIEIAL
jgi:hypothetical protein